MKRVRIPIFLLSVLTIACAEEVGGPNRQEPDEPQEEPTPENPDDAELTLKELVAKYYEPEEFVVGAASNMGDFDDIDEQVAIWLDEFGYNTPSNDFKQTQVYRTPGATWNNGGYMKCIEIARKYGQVVRSHGPMAPQCSSWAKEDNRTAVELEDMLTDYMTQLSKDLQVNSDVVLWMDVVNETFCNATLKGIGYDASLSADTYQYNVDDWFGPRLGTSNWENPWTIIGFDDVTFGGESFDIPKYIPMAFEIANKYAPDVKKIYNDHGKEMNVDVQKKLRRTVLYLRSLGLAVDGIGWQGHVRIGWEKNPDNITNLKDAIEWCHTHGMEFHVTELDVELSNTTSVSNEAYIVENEEAIADTVGAIVEILLSYVDKGAHGVNFWTMTDDTSSSTIKARLFDAKNNPSPAYYRVRELISEYGAQRIAGEE